MIGLLSRHVSVGLKWKPVVDELKAGLAELSNLMSIR